MKRIDPTYFQHTYKLELIRLGKVPPWLDAPRAKRILLRRILQLFGPN